VKLSVVIPVKDGARYLEELLAAVAGLDVLVIDSGSRDESVAIARAAGAEVLAIEPQSFGHGRTRNLGAEHVDGDLIAFLTQDATPCPGWAGAYLAAFADPAVGVAYGPHLARPDTSPMIARELEGFFAIQDQHPEFLSNVNACYRRECWEAIRFDDVPYAEDQAFARRLAGTPWRKAYVPDAAVLHAHDYPPLDFMRRYFDEYRGLRATVGHVEPIGRSSVADVKRLVAADRAWMRERGIGGAEAVRWTGRSAVHHGGRKVFSALGSRADRLPPAVRRTISLEGRDDAEAADGPPPAERRPGGEHTPWDAIAGFLREGPAPLAPPLPGRSDARSLHIAIAIPYFRRGSGGHNSIFQMAWHLERMGHSISFWLHDPLGYHGHQAPSEVRRDLREWFAPLEAPVFKGFDDFYGADVAVATGWETVYPVMGLRDCRSRAYLVHDHEPQFFATSAEQRFAAMTYDQDLFAICASPWLAEIVERDYGHARTAQFQFGVDHDVYVPRPIERDRARVVFYGRSVTGRRAVPLGLMALEELHRRRPEVRFEIFGDHKPLPTPFPHDHLGVASPRQLSWVFSRATVGLCLSMTNYSLIPQEMLACGLPCVDLAEFSAETVFGENGPVELADFDPGALADAVERLLDDRELWERRSQAGLEFVAGHTWAAAAQQVEAGLRTALRERGS
jgi:glycosyltransferase involved in cell wall biosynthesis